eukprot:scaffold225_cov235-Pinguiococcus_pyrenoidosus.AAC.5
MGVLGRLFEKGRSAPGFLLATCFEDAINVETQGGCALIESRGLRPDDVMNMSCSSDAANFDHPVAHRMPRRRGVLTSLVSETNEEPWIRSALGVVLSVHAKAGSPALRRALVRNDEEALLTQQGTDETLTGLCETRPFFHSHPTSQKERGPRVRLAEREGRRGQRREGHEHRETALIIQHARNKIPKAIREKTNQARVACTEGF